ncbi:unnamed protein product [Prorocentrum cordatum]|uniref:Ion transport domain-containing protein n=1 Tax=Prorocentrum cordatum TaxID=2364126 RepID=A0ABN9QNQ4_9DINO|nr:unnamed protein product [Polarella glacialis]
MQARTGVADLEEVSCLAALPARKPFADVPCTVPDEGDLVTLPTALGRDAAGEEGAALCAWLQEALLEERSAVARDLLSRHTAMLAELESRMRAASPRTVPKASPSQRAPPGEASEAPLRAQSRVQFEDAGPPGCVVNLRGAGEGDELVARRSGWEQSEKEEELSDHGHSSDGGDAAGTSETAKSMEGPRKERGNASSSAPSMARAANRLFKSTKSERSGNGSRRQQQLRRIVKSNAFEVFSATIIALTTTAAALEVQYHSFQIGSNLGYRWYRTSSEETWPGGGTLFEVLDYMCGVLFTVEVVLKGIALRSDFCHDSWNFLDLSVTVCWYVEVLGESYVPLDPTLLRMGRLVRLFRLLKLAKKIEGFDSLYLMTTAVRGSASSLGWSCLLLFLSSDHRRALCSFGVGQLVLGQRRLPRRRAQGGVRVLGIIFQGNLDHLRDHFSRLPRTLPDVDRARQ